MRRSISYFVAVLLLMLIAIAPVLIIYGLLIQTWLSGLIGTVHSTSPSLFQKVEIIRASVFSNGTVIADVLVPQGSPAVTIVALYVESINSTLICTAPVTATITPGSIATVSSSNCSLPPGIAPGTPLQVIVVTSLGVTASYFTTLS